MDILFYVLAGISLTVSIVSIVLSLFGRRKWQVNRIEIISAFTGEQIGYFGDTRKEKELCTQALSRMDIIQVIEKENIKIVYVKAFCLPEI